MPRLFRFHVVIATLAGTSALAAAQEQLWLRQFGTSGHDSAAALSPNGAGGAFVAGYTTGSLGGPAAGETDAWLARYNWAGNQTWIIQFGTSMDDRALALCPDGAGGLFAAGFTAGSLGGPGAGGYDVWLARYDSAGNRTWIRQFGTSATEEADALCPDGSGGVLVAGSTYGSLGGASAGDYDAWFARYDSAGNRTWIRQFGTYTSDYATALCTDGSGGAFVLGITRSNLGGPYAGSYDAWLARYDSAGVRAWIRQFGTTAFDRAAALCPDGSGGAFVAGSTEGALGGPSAGGTDVWAARFDGVGNQAWIRQFGTSAYDETHALCSDGVGGAFIAGCTQGSLGGPCAGDYDPWLARYDSAGNRSWIRQFGTSSRDFAFELCPDGTGGAYIAGETYGSLDGANAGNSDAWLGQFDSTCRADFNADGVVDFFDYLDFVGAWDTGC